MNTSQFNISGFSQHGCQNFIMGFAGALEAFNQSIA